MGRSHMERAGMDPERRAYIEARARAAERWYATLTGGYLREKMAEDGYDVILPSGTVVDVKRVPLRFRFVNGGAKRPRALVAVVEDREAGPDSFRLAGFVGQDRWRRELPPVHNAQRCWMVLAQDLAGPPTTVVQPPEPADPGPEPGSRLALGSDDPPVPDPVEAKRLKDRLAQRRMTARRKAAIGMPWADPAQVGRGLGAGGGGRPAVSSEDLPGSDWTDPKG